MTGVQTCALPILSDDANIINAFKFYHYGPNLDNVDGMQSHLDDFDTRITALEDEPAIVSASPTSLGTVYSVTSSVDSNIALGYDIGTGWSGTENVAIGASALTASAIGSQNVAIGASALSNSASGSNNIGIGYAAIKSSASVSNEITLGNSSIAALRCQVTSITSLSDERDKKDIDELKYGLNLINDIKPVSFVWDTRDGAKKNISDIGFIAQQLAEVEDKVDAAETLRLTYRENPDALEASYGRLIPILVKAIQELSQKVDTLQSIIDQEQ